MKLWKIALIALIATVVSCGTYVKQPVASHIVAVTTAGDTILVAIDKIRPNTVSYTHLTLPTKRIV